MLVRLQLMTQDPLRERFRVGALHALGALQGQARAVAVGRRARPTPTSPSPALPLLGVLELLHAQ